MHFLADPNGIEFELSSMCNALCLGCVRTDNKNFNDVKKIIPKKQMISLQNFKDVIQAPSMQTVKFLYFCGTIDDPLMHPRFFDMVKAALQWNDKFHIVVHTNASLRSTDDFTLLANLLSKFKKGNSVHFSIDGLEDTNHLYRQNTDYQKIMENASAFINAGGKAIWQYLIFPWNEHQVEEARSLSEEMGFAEFHARRDRSVASELGLEHIQNLKKIYRKRKDVIDPDVYDKFKWMEQFNEKYKDRYIECNSQKKSKYFVSYDGRLWPCCFLSNGFLTYDQPRKNFLDERIWGNYGKDFNDINKHSVDEILEHDFFMNDLTESFNNDIGLGPCGKITRCAQVCNTKAMPIGDHRITRHETTN